MGTRGEDPGTSPGWLMAPQAVGGLCADTLNWRTSVSAGSTVPLQLLFPGHPSGLHPVSLLRPGPWRLWVLALPTLMLPEDLPHKERWLSLPHSLGSSCSDMPPRLCTSPLLSLCPRPTPLHPSAPGLLLAATSGGQKGGTQGCPHSQVSALSKRMSETLPLAQSFSWSFSATYG